ncbi:MAG TPA: hypothetical protein VGO96_06365 [Pyrinomonadaceae bacterium]|jgi:hypothetical protein|nr:hypothetical protein [Pyrinomonadaceae bacterium]
MFGLGKLVGGALNAIGLGKIAPFISMGISFFTGDFATLATDVMGLMSNIKGLDFLNKVAKFAPLGGFDQLAGGFGELGLKQFLKADGLRDIADKFFKLADTLEDFQASSRKVNDLFDLLLETAQNRESLESVRNSVTYSSYISAV